MISRALFISRLREIRKRVTGTPLKAFRLFDYGPMVEIKGGCTVFSSAYGGYKNDRAEAIARLDAFIAAAKTKQSVHGVTFTK